MAPFEIPFCSMRPRTLYLLLGLLALAAPGASQQSKHFDWSGFALLDAATAPTDSAPPQPVDELAASAHLGLEWSRSPRFRAHAYLLGRTDDADSHRGSLGIVEAYVESNHFPGQSRLRLRAGAFFLPTSFENVDALWENPYTISSSALNTWFGEELRPIGVDATYFHRQLMVGATVFRGNDTLGALPPDRGWVLDNRWTLLGQRVPVGPYYTSVSDETDGRLGWSARTGWNGRRLSLQYTHFDNRSDGLLYGNLFNWNTRFDILAAGVVLGPWTLAAESGAGPTFLVVNGREIVSDIAASYFLVSRRVATGRASLRLDVFDDGERREETMTTGFTWSLARQLSLRAELVAGGERGRARLQLRYGFASW